ncbi:uncharacterized protein LOC119689396 isoform X1 [Teleopsis dalmanni]|uniref:uncharacterized protein LOC119689396 isoform X1 n=1 Tax=Teleopsis dalmanni TaxID=139649 RepID=UPI0018CEB24B|nr:uncharacterized protein LOC119689396 isoform X1 [Teleopsis dalmanni]XP_037960149.1 uncharacterized protein LOC119689396 isoform X1 [Teleopsis dalmanni]
MWKLLFICLAVTIMNTAAGSYASAGGFAGASAGGFGTGGYTGGYAGDYGTGNFVGTGFGYAPEFGFGFIDPFVFHQQLTASILAQHAAQNSALASTYSTGDASVYADASQYPDDEQIQQQIAAQQGYFDNVRRQPGYYNKGYKSHRYAPNFAAAGASIGPGGYTQTAYISPENPSVPNIHNRFSSGSGPGGYKGVSVSSFSSSSDVDGKRTNYRGAQTTINDNGKVTTYRVHS